jgi:hypothetical protein
MVMVNGEVSVRYKHSEYGESVQNMVRAFTNHHVPPTRLRIPD